MQEAVLRYLADIQSQLATGHAQEHSYRPALKALFDATTQLKVVNEPKGSAHGRPDFIFLKGEIPIAWVEAKDVHINLEKIEKSEQMARYFGYANLILTNGLEFRFYKNGQKYGDPIIIAVKKGDTLEAHPDAAGMLVRTLKDFIEGPIDTIRSASHLAKIMGGKARLLRENVMTILDQSSKRDRGDLDDIFEILKSKLIHDLTLSQFADIYAQTLVYGLFVARYHDSTKDTFSRMEARDCIPKSNHLLRHFFDHIAGANFVKDLSYIIDELCDVFLHSDVRLMFKKVSGELAKATNSLSALWRQGSSAELSEMQADQFFQALSDPDITKAHTRIAKILSEDPIIHFYEDFLREYDPKLRVDRGVFYTPLPVVRYIVRSVDALLKQHFGLAGGLIDRSQVEHISVQQKTKSKIMIDRVQILDPAVGTGTFLNEVIRFAHGKYELSAGEWPAYVNDHLIPRLHGFELMMASYTIAHLKLSMTLAESGITDLRKRLKIYLTNSLEEASEKDDSLFSLGLQGALTEEAMAADEVKRDLPIMVVMGNPPYSVSSQNASVEIGSDGRKRKTWIGNLIDDYKKDLNEKKINLDDDYIKFIRFSHHLIDKNGQGIVAMITNNSFLDGITHRRMRESLLQTFDHLYVLDLHGNSKRKEQAPDGSKDENVFDIQQGVCIFLFVKTSAGKKKALGKVHHFDLYGKQEYKYNYLDNNDVTSTDWQELEAPKPGFFFVPKDFGLMGEYEKGLKLGDLFGVYGSGVKTERDRVSIHWTENDAKKSVEDFRTLSDQELRLKYDLGKDSRDWTVQGAKKDVKNKQETNLFKKILYRPFDTRFTWYSGQTRGYIGTPGFPIMSHLLSKNNISLLVCRQQASSGFRHIFVSNQITECCSVSNRTREMTYTIPLYTYLNSPILDEAIRIPNLLPSVYEPVLKKLKLDWVSDGVGDGKSSCGPEDIFDYIYAVLHSPTYRERYKEFLKIDFPRVSFTSNAQLFWKLVSLGREIRKFHLLEHPALGERMTSFPVVGDNVVEKISFDCAQDDKSKGKVWINATQYFEGVSETAWNFPIGGYQPLQKWLKDRKGRTLSSDDLDHWQKIVVALTNTDRLMREVDGVIVEGGGFPIL